MLRTQKSRLINIYSFNHLCKQLLFVYKWCFSSYIHFISINLYMRCDESWFYASFSNLSLIRFTSIRSLTIIQECLPASCLFRWMSSELSCHPATEPFFTIIISLFIIEAISLCFTPAALLLLFCWHYLSLFHFPTIWAHQYTWTFHISKDNIWSTFKAY